MLAIGASSGAQAQVAAISQSPIVAATRTIVEAASTGTATVITVPAATPAILSTTIRPSPSSFGTIAGPAAIRPSVTHASLWPLIYANIAGPALDEEQTCVATAVYFEARGEPFDGQLAVAEVVQNRARSGRYPTSLCAVVKQPWQFSFVRSGRFPRIDSSSAAWGYAQAIARIASNRLADALPEDVLWYHADYVAPGWGRRLSRVDKIGAHIFYRS